MKSRLETAAEQIIKDLGLDYEREARFHPSRRWRADFKAWTANRACLIECEGLTRYGNHLGRHQTPKGFAADCEKYNTAQVLGFPVFRFVEDQIADGTMESTLRRFFWPDTGGPRNG